jgi:hypothetical protein
MRTPVSDLARQQFDLRATANAAIYARRWRLRAQSIIGYNTRNISLF